MMRAPFVLLVVIAATRAAAAAPEEDPAAAPARPPWSFAMVGGVELPTGAMKASHERGLAAGVRVAWTSRLGLGVEALVDYSPLPRRPGLEGERADTTYGTAAIGPRFAAGWRLLRFAIEAGGGVAIDHTTTTGPLLPAAATATDVAPAAEIGVELEISVVSGGGITITGGGTRAFGPLDYQYGWAMGGLAMSF